MKKQTKKRIIGIVIMTAALAAMIAITVALMKPVMKLSANPEILSSYLRGTGIRGYLSFVALVILQVFAAIVPGGPFEIAAGYAFGIVRGTLICDLAMTAGSIITFSLTRRFGMEFVELFVKKEELESLRILRTDDKFDAVLFLLFLIPGTPKDLLSYFVGLTDLPLSRWMFINLAGRLPAILLSTVSGSALSAKRYEISLAVFAVIIVCFIIGTLWYRRRNNLKDKKNF